MHLPCGCGQYQKSSDYFDNILKRKASHSRFSLEVRKDDAGREKDMIARRAEELAPFMVMEALERAREMEWQGEDIINLEVGEPDLDVPFTAREPPDGLEEGATHYTNRLGDVHPLDFGSKGEGYLRFSYAQFHREYSVGRRRLEQQLKDASWLWSGCNSFLGAACGHSL